MLPLESLEEKIGYRFTNRKLLQRAVTHRSFGAENNELALTNNKHGEVAKYFSYNKHQMVPDMLIGNLKFLNSLSDEEREVFEEAARLSTEVELEEWDLQVEEDKKIA